MLGFAGFFIVTDGHAVVKNNHTLALVIPQGSHLAKLRYLSQRDTGLNAWGLRFEQKQMAQSSC